MNARSENVDRIMDIINSVKEEHSTNNNTELFSLKSGIQCSSSDYSMSGVASTVEVESSSGCQSGENKHHPLESAPLAGQHTQMHQVPPVSIFAVPPNNSSLQAQGSACLQCGAVGCISQSRTRGHVLIQCRMHCSFDAGAWLSTASWAGDTTDDSALEFSLLMCGQMLRTSAARVEAILREAQRVIGNDRQANILLLLENTFRVFSDFPILYVSEGFLSRNGIAAVVRDLLNHMYSRASQFRVAEKLCTRDVTAFSACHSLNVPLTKVNRDEDPTNCLFGNVHSLVHCFDLMCVKFIMILNTVTNINTVSSNASSMQSVIVRLRQELLQSLAARSGLSLPIPYADRIPVKGNDARLLTTWLSNGSYFAAVDALDRLRENQGAMWGCCSMTTEDTLLLAYCRDVSLNGWALIGISEEELFSQVTAVRLACLNMGASLNCDWCRRLTEENNEAGKSSATDLQVTID